MWKINNMATNFPLRILNPATLTALENDKNKTRHSINTLINIAVEKYYKIGKATKTGKKSKVPKIE